MVLVNYIIERKKSRQFGANEPIVWQKVSLTPVMKYVAIYLLVCSYCTYSKLYQYIKNILVQFYFLLMCRVSVSHLCD